jgi:hypothetical protein
MLPATPRNDRPDWRYAPKTGEAAPPLSRRMSVVKRSAVYGFNNIKEIKYYCIVMREYYM